MAHAHSQFPAPIVANPFLSAKSGIANDNRLAVTVAHSPARAIEVLIAWGDDIIGVVHRQPVSSITLGEGASAGHVCDIVVPSEILGSPLHTLIAVEAGQVLLSVPNGARGAIGDQPLSPGQRIELVEGMQGQLVLGSLLFKIHAMAPEARVARALGAGLDRGLVGSFASSLFSIGGLMLSLAYFVPPLTLNDDETPDVDQVRVIQQYLASIAERERTSIEKETPVTDPGDQAGQVGHRSPGQEGRTGSLTSKNTRGRLGIMGKPDNTEVRLGRREALEMARSFGMVELLGMMNSGARNVVSAPWGDANPSGRDDRDAIGLLFGDTIDDAAGFGGLGLTGTGEGGGCRGPGCGLGIGIGEVGTIGGGLGICDPAKGPCNGMGVGGGHQRGGHKTRVPVIRPSVTIVSGRLPPEVIQRVVRQNHGRFRFCYEQGLTRNPNLEGRVSARFVIGRDGAVSNVADGGSNLPDSAVHSCVLGAFYGLSFPAPEGGIVTVSYPIQFSPG